MIKFYESQKILSHITQLVDPIELNTRHYQSSIESMCQRSLVLCCLSYKRYIITYQGNTLLSGNLNEHLYRPPQKFY